MTTFQPRQCLGEDLEDQEPPDNLSLQSRTHVVLEEQEEEKESPSFGRCRPLSRVADSGPKSKVRRPFISTLLSLKKYPRMCGHIPEPESRPSLSLVNPSSTPGALTSRGRPNKGPADVYPPPKPREQPHPGLAEGLGQPRKLSWKPPSLRERPHPRPADGQTTTLVTPTGEPRERPHLRPAEGLEQPKKLQQRQLPP